MSPYNIFFVFGPKMIFYHKQKKCLLKNKTYFMFICFPDQDTLVDSCAQIAIPVLISGYVSSNTYPAHICTRTDDSKIK